MSLLALCTLCYWLISCVGETFPDLQPSVSKVPKAQSSHVCRSHARLCFSDFDALSQVTCQEAGKATQKEEKTKRCAFAFFETEEQLIYNGCLGI